MTAYPTFYPANEIDTPNGMTLAKTTAEIPGVPTTGTGLSGAAYITNGSMRSIDDLRGAIAAGNQVATFTSTEITYGTRKSDTTIKEFLEEDGDSLEGLGNLEMGPSGMVFTGFMYIPEGTHEISVTSDDGFALSIGGVDFSSFEGIRGAETTSRVAEFDGGLYPIELLYFDQGGPQSVSLEIDGMPVDQSAFYTAADDIIDNPAGAPLIPVEDYHPSQTLGEAIVDDPETINGTAGADVIDAMGGDDVVNAGEGDDTVYGGYGDDNIDGGGGNDVLIGGRGSDWVKGGTGDDTIVSRSDAGEQKIGQIVVGNVTRPDNGEVNYDRQKLIGWEKQALVADDILTGGEGKDTFLFTPLINAKLEIIEKHVRSDGTINWGGVAGENTYVHDHWVDSFGIDMITDFNAEEDQIVIAGHTAEICDVSYRDTDGDGDVETIITVWSNQSGPCVATGEAKCHCASDNARAGGAHDQDLLGQIIVHGDRVEKSDILVDAGVTYGVVETFDEIEEALFPLGETKVTEIDGETVYGYDTRESDGGWGAVTGSPEDYLENPFLAEASFADPTPMVEVELTRDPFEQLTVETAAGQTIEGDNSGNTLAPDTPAPVEGDGLPGALGYWSMAGGTDGAYEDGRGEQAAIKTYTLYENQALLRTDAATEGPDGTPGTAISFNGEDQFAYLEHDTAYEVTQGTIALWVRADNLDETGAIVTKDQRNSGEGGHFRLIQEDDGHLHLRFAPGNGEGNKEWETKNPVLTEGEWTHLAVSFTEDGVTVYKNGNAIRDNAWKAVTGDVPNPGAYGEAYILQNQEPWVFGADQRRTDRNETAAEFASDDEDLDSAFEGAMAGFGIWGGSDKEDALDGAEIKKLINEGPGTALTAPSGPQPMLASDDTINGNGGNDKIDGGAGDDIIDAGNGSDTVHGGYGDDWIEGGNGNDFLDGGRGSDRLDGGNGNDILLSGADMGEQRIGQLVIGENSRELDQYEDPSVDEQYLKLIDWIDQPLIADDILTGGAGADEFRFETYINGKKDILLEHAMPNRMIHWHGVAGENKYLHDHWVDGFGIDIITDYNASEDTISVKGHTTEVKVDYKSIDTDENGVNDTVVSIITAYSQQGNGGGAHDEDYLGYIVVYGDLVDEDDIITDAGVHYGIVDTIDELQEALAPTGETRTKTLPDGTELFGIDSRDVEGNPIESDPEAYSENPWLDQVTMEGNTINPGDAPAMVMSYASGTFDGTGGYEIPHDSDHALTEGTLAMRFTADTVDGQQALFSKDHSGFKDGGHLTVSINDGRIEVRIQDTDSSTYLHSKRILEEGETYDIAFTFGPDGLKLYLDGVLVDEDEAMPQGISLNAEDTMIGASTRKRWEEDDRLEWFYDGEIEHLALYDRPISQVEAILLHEGGSDPVMIGIGEQTTPPPTDDPGDDPDSPTYPDDPEEPDTPDEPEEPDTPDEPEEPETPDEPEEPEEPEDEDTGSEATMLSVGLYDTDTGELVSALSSETTLDMSLLEGRNLAVAAGETEAGEAIESVRMTYEGGQRVENFEPYAQFADRGWDDLRGGWTYEPGTYDFKLEAYSENGANGELLETVDISLTVTGTSTPDDNTDDPGTDQGDASDPAMEIGSVQIDQEDSDEWHVVTFSAAIEDARVVMGPLTLNGEDPAMMRIKDVTDTGFKFQIDEWDYLDGSHMAETVSWMAVSAGTHTLDNGQTISAGRATAVNDATTTVTIGGFDDTPAVFTQVSSVADDAAVTTRVTDTGTGGFSFLMQEEEDADGQHASETVDWIAIEYGTDGPIDVFDAKVSHRNKAVSFDDVDGDQGFLASMQTMEGGDTAVLRVVDLDDDRAVLQVDEEISYDSETWHTLEDIAALSAETGRYDLV